MNELVYLLVRTNSISETLRIVDKQLITKYILPNNRKSSNNLIWTPFLGQKRNEVFICQN